MGSFGGWSMPLAYPMGTLAEHRACRSATALFDVSHLGTVRVLGPDALARLQRALGNDLRRIEPGRAQYSALLDPEDASVLDDVIVWWLAPERFDVMPNASNTERVCRALGGTDVTTGRAVVAVQGPGARSCLQGIWPEAAEVGRFEVTELPWLDLACVVAGTGYTGEDGLEIAVPPAVAPALWEALVEAGAVPAGLAARDTLRLEAGLPLHGHELGPGITPLQAGLGWSVGWDKPELPGRQALEAERRNGPARRLRGIVLDGRRPAREGQSVRAGDRELGVVTSGNFSPTLERGIALALLRSDVEPEMPVEVLAPSAPLPGRVVPTPFVHRRSSSKAR